MRYRFYIGLLTVSCALGTLMPAVLAQPPKPVFSRPVDQGSGETFRTGVPVIPFFDWTEASANHTNKFRLRELDRQGGNVTDIIVNDVKVSESKYNADDALVLQPSTWYRARAMAINGNGVAGDWSDEIEFQTRGNIEVQIEYAYFSNVGTKPFIAWTAADSDGGFYEARIRKISGGRPEDTYDSGVQNVGDVESYRVGVESSLFDELKYSTTYELRVRRASLGLGGPWTYATVTVKDPDIPAITNPEDGEKERNISPIIRWSSTDHGGYVLRLRELDGRDGSYVSNVIDDLVISNKSITSYDLDVHGIQLKPLTWYRTKVQSYVPNNVNSYWSTGVQFRTKDAVTQSVLNFRVEELATRPTSPALRWDTTPGGDQYELRVEKMSGGQAAHTYNVSTPAIGTGYRVGEGAFPKLKYQTTYKASIALTRDGLTGPWVGQWFNTGNPPIPSITVVDAPAYDGMSNVSINARIQWRGTDADRYWVRLLRTSGRNGINQETVVSDKLLLGNANTNFSLASHGIVLDYETWYRVHVKGGYAQDIDSDWSQPFDFKTEPPPPLLDAKVLLEGAVTSNAMHTLLRAGNLIPLKSPYLLDPRVVSALPSNMVDWVLVELREETNTPPVFVESGMLLSDGSIRSTDDEDGLKLNYLEGEYYVQVKHRNHVSLTSTGKIDMSRGLTTLVDFGNLQQAGMKAGDSDADGRVTDADMAMVQAYQGHTGYLRADMNLDGVVGVDDLNRVLANTGVVSSTARPMVLVDPVLYVKPRIATVVQHETHPMRIENGIPELGWSFVENLSGGAVFMTTSGGVFQAGAAPGTDIVSVWDGSNAVGHVRYNVVSSNYVAQQGKAIILSGGRSLIDPVWTATDHLASQAYLTLRQRGYSADTIQYLSFHASQTNDVDEDGLVDVDGGVDLLAVEDAIVNWASNANHLVLYLVDHGSVDVQTNGYFTLNQQENLSSSNLNLWVSALQNAYSNEVSIILEFCYAGSFLPELAASGSNAPVRTVIASTREDELTHYIAGGAFSFSSFFFSALRLGRDFQSAFAEAFDVMAGYPQHGMLDDNGDGITNSADGVYAATRFLGDQSLAIDDRPVIATGMEPYINNSSERLLLTIDDISSEGGVRRVWCIIRPPDYFTDFERGEPVVDLYTVELTNNAAGEWDVEADVFGVEGIYQLSFFVEDYWGSVSLPYNVIVDQKGFLEKVVLVGGSVDSDAYTNLLVKAVDTYKLLGVKSENIHVLTGHPELLLTDAISNSAPGMASLSNVVNQWAADADRLTLHFIGSGRSNDFSFSEGEVLDAGALNLWLNTIQGPDQQINLIMDWAGSGKAVGELHTIAPGLKPRVIIASSRLHRRQAIHDELNFSSLFLDGLSSRQSVGKAASMTRRVLRRMSGNVRQQVLIDDNGNGLPNEKGTDGLAAASGVFIGTPVWTGNNKPTIGTVISNAVIANTESLKLWAGDVFAPRGVSNVWVEITPPTNSLGNLGIRLELSTNQLSMGNYENFYHYFSSPGNYGLAFYVQDMEGIVGEPVLSSITRAGSPLPEPSDLDQYEVDDLPEQRTQADLPIIQYHSLHHESDHDWVSFYASSNYIYDIETVHLGTNIDTRIEIYFESTNGWMLLDAVDEFGHNQGELTGLDFEQSGQYALKISHDTNFPFSPGSYQLIVYIPVGVDGLTVYAWDKVRRRSMSGIVINLMNVHGGVIATQVTDVVGEAVFHVAPGEYLVGTPPAPGLLSYSHPTDQNKSPGNTNSYYGNPKRLYYGNGIVTYEEITGLTWEKVDMHFSPVAYVTGRVGNAMFDIPIAEASLVFSNQFNGLVFDSYPWGNTFNPKWETELHGGVSDNVYLWPEADYLLKISKPGYSNYYLAITNVQQGDVIVLDELMTALLGANEVPDHYELEYFGSSDTSSSTNDVDGDGLSLVEEWIANTSPTNDASAFHIPDVISNPDGSMTLHWEMRPYRSYKVRSRSDLMAAGEATTRFSVSNMTPHAVQTNWTDALMNDAINAYFIEVSLPGL